MREVFVSRPRGRRTSSGGCLVSARLARLGTLVPAEDRARILAALECVDAVMASNGNHDRIREAVIAAGSGYRSAGAYRAA